MPPAVALLNYISCGILWRIFLPNWDISRFFFYTLFTVRISDAAMGGAGDIIFSAWLFFILFAERISEAAMSRTGVGGYYVINMTITELYCTFTDFFSKIGITEGFSLCNINFAEMRWEGGAIIVFRLQRSSVRILRRSVGCSVAQKDTA